MLPERLQKGDTIGVASPSDPVKFLEQNVEFIKGISFLEKIGLKVKIGENICSSNPKERAEDINNFFKDENIKAIICSQGGDSAQEVLKFVDFSTIKSNPKIFTGLSDNTVLLNAIYSNAELVSFHGNDVRFGFGREYYKYNEKEFIDRLMKGAKGHIEPNGERKTVRKGSATGRLLGGNLRCLLKLAGTSHWPDFDGAILFLESFHMTVENCRKYFKILESEGTFGRISGALVGFNFGMQVEHPKETQMEEILLEFTRDHSFPILKVNDFGHNCANTVLPVGSETMLDATSKKIRLTEAFVK